MAAMRGTRMDWTARPGVGSRVGAGLAMAALAWALMGGPGAAQEAEEAPAEAPEAPAAPETPEAAPDATPDATPGTTPDAGSSTPPSTGTSAEVSTNQVAVSTAWSVFVETDPALECWGVSGPATSVNTRDGEPVEVQRGDTLLFIAYRPAAGVEGEVSFTGGYPFAENSTVTMQVGEDSFELFTRGEFAWPVSNEDDARIVDAMRRGRDVLLTGRSARGTQTDDTFSLMGFSAALEEAQGRCAEG